MNQSVMLYHCSTKAAAEAAEVSQKHNIHVRLEFLEAIPTQKINQKEQFAGCRGGKGCERVQKEPVKSRGNNRRDPGEAKGNMPDRTIYSKYTQI
jgi:hypothetical protein